MKKTAQEIASDVVNNLENTSPLDAATKEHKRQYFAKMDPHTYAGLSLGGALGILPLLSQNVRNTGILAGIYPLVGGGLGALSGRVVGRHLVGPYQKPTLEELQQIMLAKEREKND